MKYEIKQVDEAKGIVRITTADERWYHAEDEDIFYGSSTWICGYLPKETPFYKWLASKGWDDAEAIKMSRGNSGSKTHNGCEILMKGKELKIDDSVKNNKGELEELSTEEWEAIMSFRDWFKETNPKVLKVETIVISRLHRYAGTLDILCEIDGQLWVIDLKTSQYIWDEHKIQLSSYKQGVIECFPEHKDKDIKLGILQLGYKRNKKKFKFTEIEDNFDLFLAVKKIWFEKCKNIKPLQKDYPLKLSL
jgi:hypothetical protein